MDALRNLRYAARTLLRSRGFAAVAVLTLALGIGANTAIFSVVNAVLLRPLPYAHPERLVTVFHFYPSLNNLEAGAAVPTFREMKEQTRVFDAVAVQSFWGVNFTGTGEPERLAGSQVSGDWFGAYGVPAALGRTLRPGDDEKGHEKVVVLGDGLWRRAFGADPRVVGRTMQLNGEAYEIVGVMPPGFRDFFTQPAEIWSPVVFDPETFNARTSEFLSLTARLRPGVSVRDGERAMTAFASRLKADNPGAYPTDWTLHLRSLSEQATGKLRPALLVLLGAVGFVLLIACGNVANLLLSRAATRSKEVAIRSALGASGASLVRQFLVESLLISLTGGVAGIALAMVGLRMLRASNPSNLPWLADVSIDGRVLLFTFGVAVATGVVFGLVPALQSARVDLQSTLREGGRSGGEGRGRAVRRVLVVAEVALALVLLSGAGLLIRSFAELRRVSPGFDPEGVLTLNLALPEAKYGSDTAKAAFFDALLPRVAALPGVQAAGAISGVPFGRGGWTRSFQVEGFQPAADEPRPWGDFRVVSADYHRAMRIPLLRGRFFSGADRMDSRRVVIVDRSLADRYWPGQDPIGKRIGLPKRGSDDPDWLDVVGVVGHVAQNSLDAQPKVQLYVPLPQMPLEFMSLAVRATGDPNRLVGPVRAAVRSVDPDQPISDVSTLRELLESSVGQRRFSMLLLGFFAGVALLLASIGIYGVISFDVARRSHEIGVRMALGAERGSVLALVLRQGMRLALVGVGIGVAGSLGLTRLMASQLYGVGATDPATLVSVVVLLVGVAVLATLIPARRATRVDPLVALRTE